MPAPSVEKKKRRQVCVQLSEDLKGRLVQEARRVGRSLQKEVEFRLEWSIREDKRLGLIYDEGKAGNGA